MPDRFDRDTALEPLGAGAFRGRIDPGWWVQRGPNGGYVAAIALRAMTAVVDDRERFPRSLTVHYLRAPDAGEVEVTAVVEREGRSLTSVSARMTQDGRTCVLALAAFARSRDADGFDDTAMPEVPVPDELPTRAELGLPGPAVSDRYEQRVAIGGAPLSGAPAVTGGWTAPAEPRLLDPLLATAFMDGWIPPAFIRMAEPPGVPTIDLTVHFRAPLPPPGATPDTQWLVRFESRLAADGFVEEDGELWSPDGRLLVQSRQLSLMSGRGPLT